MDKIVQLKDVRKAFRKTLFEKGYREYVVPYENTLYCKRLENNLIISLVFEKSGLYTNRWTATLGIGITSWAFYEPRDLNNQRRRVNHRIMAFLTDAEKTQLGLPHITDLWWDTLDDKAISLFLKMFEIAEKKLESDRELAQLVLDNEYLKEDQRLMESIIRAYENGESKDSYDYCPARYSNAEMIPWLHAAEIVLEKGMKKSERKYMPYGVRACGARAFRYYDLMKNKPTSKE